MIHLFAIQAAGFRIGQRQFLHRTGQANIGQTAFLFQAATFVHDSLSDAYRALLPARVFAFTAHAQTSFAKVDYEPGDVLMFGSEPDGLNEATLADPHITEQVRIPMLAGRRSLNLSNAAAVAAYEAWRQCDFMGSA